MACALVVADLQWHTLLDFVIIWRRIRNIMKWSMKWPNGNVLSRHTFFLWPYMVSCGALQWPLNIRWCWCTTMCHWLRDITLSSNDFLHFYTFTQLSGKFGQTTGWCPLLLFKLELPSGKSWIHHRLPSQYNCRSRVGLLLSRLKTRLGEPVEYFRPDSMGKIPNVSHTRYWRHKRELTRSMGAEKS